ncbi:MAG: thermonuclease family protein [Candidatus Caenarcaniphilales bacterium]|nr:thermonuclease family protein [Candidatus Caenarcaniphilales bacterium]
MNYLLTIFFLIFISSSCNKNIFYGKVIQIFDGDTVKIKKCLDKKCKQISSEQLRIRLLGIDCPEIKQEQWGKRAKEELEALIPDSQVIRLETDIVKKDKYGRTLAYLYATGKTLNSKDKSQQEKVLQSKSLNEHLLRKGLAQIFILAPNNKYSDNFKRAESLARKEKLNIWDLENGLKHSPYKFRKIQKRKSKLAYNKRKK